MSDAYRDDYEATLQRAAALHRENEALRARLSRYEHGEPEAPSPRVAPIARSSEAHTGASVLAATLLSTTLLAGTALVAATAPARRAHTFGPQGPCPYARAAMLERAHPCPYARAAHARWLAEQSVDAALTKAQRADASDELEPTTDATTSAIAGTDVRGGTLRIELEGAPATSTELRVDGAPVTLRGRVGTVPGLTEGLHTLRVAAPGFAPYEQETWVRAGLRQTLVVELLRDEGPDDSRDRTAPASSTRDPFHR